VVKGLGWGVDGFGCRHYVCAHCELYFGDVDPYEIKHDCDKSKPKYHNRGVIFDWEKEKERIADLHYEMEYGINGTFWR